jgi:hypothetical protein
LSQLANDDDQASVSQIQGWPPGAPGGRPPHPQGELPPRGASRAGASTEASSPSVSSVCGCAVSHSPHPHQALPSSPSHFALISITLCHHLHHGLPLSLSHIALVPIALVWVGD